MSRRTVHPFVLDMIEPEDLERQAADVPAFEPLDYLRDYRDRQDFLLSREPYRGASILVVAAIVGAESFMGTEGGLPALGIRVVIAPGFGSAFFSEAVRHGVLPIALPRDVIEEMLAWVEANPRQEMTVDLEAQVIDIPGGERTPFEAPPRVRHKLLHGLDDLDELLQHREDAAAFRIEDRNRRPWLYATGAPVKPASPSSGGDD
jgi:3-isopropylmalate/(R)-2-methylmalate dehydratase small subunit